MPKDNEVDEKVMPVAWSVLQIGSRGASYDPKNSKRAFTYEKQPGNVDASRLGGALDNAANASYGDSIDRGLALLKALQESGFGVFQIGATTPQPSADAVRELVRRWRGSGKDWYSNDFDIRGSERRKCADELESLLSGGSNA